jgi:hypothetical protein
LGSIFVSFLQVKGEFVFHPKVVKVGDRHFPRVKVD